jgi:homocysteine S-methyltransferase
MQDPLAAVAINDVIILDGAMASELERRGCDLNDALWSARVLLEAPELIRQVHYDYYAAGADVATTASYQASFEGFAQRGIGHEQAVALMQQSVRLAQEARDAFCADAANLAGRQPPLVAASVGPYGAILADGSEYRGGYGLSVQQLMDFHRPRLAALLAAGPDLLAGETFPCAEEALALATLLRDEFPDARAWVSFSCRDAANLSDGTPLADAVAALADFPQIVAVGVNCTAPRHIAPLLGEAARVSGKRLLTYPNSGESYDATTKTWHGSSDPGAFADAARQWRAAGAACIGGCCRTTPEDIRALSAWLRPVAR